MLRKSTLFSLMLFLAGLLVFVISGSTQQQQSLSAFTLRSRETFIPADGGPARHIADIEQFTKSNAATVVRTTHYGRNGEVKGTSLDVGLPGFGTFRIDPNKPERVFISAFAERRSVPTIEALKTNAEFVREENVLGYRAAVMRTPGSTPARYVEQYIAPELQGYVIKRLIATEEGTTIKEPVDVQPGEPPDAPFASLPKYRVSFAEFDSKVTDMESRTGKPAEEMRKLKQKVAALAAKGL
jgi:hypothetical protein